ncbi:PREDICTED: nucleolar protein 58 [Dufourea novaeangliae]|uniref:Nucleolar protein 58 n=1 Tax=Dufourea novaeangliae TaxID=178035 RepID=A0A154PKI1_DUFNO|nr:PREDICTED: nucleolar protein 58 [Dufourea novaeangliae]KZC12356.1 Nucleolar protein 58 [Dufourea novaeangliae]
MLVLFETPAGYAIFKLLDENKLAEVDNLFQDFETPETASKIVKLKHFEKFADTTEALAATTAAVEGKLSKSLKKILKKYCFELQEQLAVADAKLGNAIKDKLSLSCISNTAIQELMRCIRSQIDGLLAGLPKKEMTAMALGLAHSLSRYKLKFSPDKIDTMIVQAVCLLDDLDKELNNYVMRCREWYGWHFPELGKIVTDNVAFVKTVKIIGTRENTVNSDLSDILPEDVEEKVKEAAEISMGTEISDDDILNIQHLCDQVIEISQYRSQLYDYLKARMMAMAPNLTVLVGELVGARLISHAGSLINLAKHPASTVQILGAEKALFRALKTKKDTPKYGLIYHAQLVGQASVKNKGKMSRMLAAKAALATRVDALGEDSNFDLGAEHKVKLEARLRILEEGNLRRISGTGKAKAKFEKYQSKSEYLQYPASADTTLPSIKRRHSEIEDKKPLSEDKKPLIEEIMTKQDEEVPKKKKKRQNTESADESMIHQDAIQIKVEDEITPVTKKKKKKAKVEISEEASTSVTEDQQLEVSQTFDEASEVTEEQTKKKKKKIKQEVENEDVEKSEETTLFSSDTVSSEKKKKKKKKSQDE